MGGNCSNPSLLQLLTAAEEGDKEHPNQCLYSEVTEIQRLYKMGTDNGKYGVADLIKAAFDRAKLDSNRFSAGGCNAYTPARWNFSAATTPEGARNFFSGVLPTDGTLSQVAFIMLPEVDIPSNKFYLGSYDDEFKHELDSTSATSTTTSTPLTARGRLCRYMCRKPTR